MSAVLPQPGARTSAVIAVLVVVGGLALSWVLVRGSFATVGMNALMHRGGMPEPRRVPAAPQRTERPPR